MKLKTLAFLQTAAYLLAAAVLWLTLRYLAAGQPSRPGNWGAPTACGVQCGVCPSRCYLPEGSAGQCGQRVNRLGDMGNVD